MKSRQRESSYRHRMFRGRSLGRLFTIPIAATVMTSLLLTACENYKLQHLKNCKLIMELSVELAYAQENGGPKPPLSAKPALTSAANNLCECRIRSIEALEDVLESDKQAYYHKGIWSDEISKKSYPAIKVAFDACDREHKRAVAAAK